MSMAVLTFQELVGMLAAYALGCLATGYYLVRWKTGADIRTLGSGNIGARNVGRALGNWGFVATFIGDFAKGALAVWGARVAGFELPGVVWAMLVVVGHNWPIQLQFRGGKGIATSLGALVFFDVRIVGMLVVAFLIVLAVLRRFTSSGLLAYAVLPLLLFWPMEFAATEIIGVAGLSALVLAAHRQNLREEIVRRRTRSKL